MSQVDDINRLASFLAHEQISSLSECPDVDCVVLCVSAILHCAESVFDALAANPKLAKVLVLCGGIGHSTSFLIKAVEDSPRYSHLSSQVQCRAEAQVMNIILQDYLATGRSLGECRVLIEDQSTNCGGNASETRKVLEANGIAPKKMVIVQDPTMSLRTTATFRKTFADLEDPPAFISWPTFVPKVCESEVGLRFDVGGVGQEELWPMSRFLGLLLGEIPRLRDDEMGYGPKGRGFIGHVYVFDEVEVAWARLKDNADAVR